MITVEFLNKMQKKIIEDANKPDIQYVSFAEYAEFEKYHETGQMGPILTRKKEAFAELARLVKELPIEQVGDKHWRIKDGHE
jgi:hypothetical protein